MDGYANTFRNRVILFCLIAGLGLGVDLLTKWLVFGSPRLFHGSEWWLIPNHVGIQKSLNEGALFGMGQGKVWVFAFLALAAAIAIPVWLFRFGAAEQLGLTLALGCIMGGVLGNLYDRIGLSGLTWDQFNPTRSGESVNAVRDWILFQVNENWVWPNFNIADSLLVVGAGILILKSFVDKQPVESVVLETSNKK